MTDVVIIDALRTPIGALGGALSRVRPDDLAALVLKRSRCATSWMCNEIDEVYFGCANQAGEDNRNVARMAALLAGFPPSVPGITLNRLCASGLSAVNSAFHAIKAGEGEVMLAGGVESMSRAPYSFPKAESGFPFGNLTAYDTALGWRYPNSKMAELYGTEPMGETAENIAAQTGITRAEQDAFAVESHRRAVAAIDSGKFAEEILPVSIPQKKGDALVVDHRRTPQARRHDGIPGQTQTRLQGGWQRDRGQFLRDERRRGSTAGDERGQSQAIETAAAGEDHCQRQRRGGTARDGAGSGAGGEQSPGARRAENHGYRTGGTERSLCRAGAGSDARTRAGCRAHQRQRRRHRAGASFRLLGRAHPHHAASTK